jgi:hypothetical protein
MRRPWLTIPAALAALLITAAPALACGGLIGPNGAVNLLRTTTFAGYHDGIEHYVTAFEFAGGGGAFGSITPLPGIPTDVERGGDWTLQRLVRETDPIAEEFSLFRAASADAAGEAEVLLETTIDALDITILRGGGDEVGLWAKNHGFRLPPDAPEVLDFYADRSPIFMAARFDVGRAEASGQRNGDGTPIHLVIPTSDPWVPLRILGLGRQPNEIVSADVFLLTDEKPNLLPAPQNKGVVLSSSGAASSSLLRDLASDKGMKWLPRSGMHLSFLKIDTPARKLKHDLAIDPTGTRTPSFVDAGLVPPPARMPSTVPGTIPWTGIGGTLLLVSALILYMGRSPARPV